MGIGYLMLSIALPMLLHAGEGAPKSDMGNYYPFLKEYSSSLKRTMSYSEAKPADLEAWRTKGRAKFQELLAYSPTKVSPEPEILEEVSKPGYKRTKLRYRITADQTTEAYLLIPDGLTAPAPAIVALHCHSGIYYYGKEKLVEVENPTGVLKDLWAAGYGGRTVADELARQGYVVFVPDAFYFGSQRLDVSQIPESFTRELAGLEDGSDAWIRAYNGIASKHESLVAKSIFSAGMTWPGIMLQGDIASLDYLLTRPEVDAKRVGCIGLSIGGYRSALLFAMDRRIKAGVVAGWMTTFHSLLFDHLHSHTWMLYVPRQQEFFDLPDLVTFNAPNPLMVIDCKRDSLFTMDGMQAAESKIREVYTGIGAPDAFRCNYYDLHHSLAIEAQNDAIAWFNAALK
jgi:dienelactone hydrolase